MRKGAGGWIGLLWCLMALLARPSMANERCQDCHRAQWQAWQDSHHQQAMMEANSASVLGQFDGQTLDQQGFAARLYQQQDQYFALLSDGRGQSQVYRILYTFGVYPLQQYLVALPGGRLQLIPFAWDARPSEQGGQRWFLLHPEQGPADPFYWTNPGQNWNSTCADCHVTGFTKGYDPGKHSFDSQYQALGVTCEACHGDTSEHQRWARQDSESRQAGDAKLARNLAKPVSHWQWQQGRATASAINPSDQVLVCAQCHSRRRQVADVSTAEYDFHRAYRLNRISPALYYADGQVRDENYVVGSFMLSRMHQQGVVCSHCHQPHSTELKLPEPQLCLQCHQQGDYDSPAHHHHPAGSAGAQCTGCHMPKTTYMQVDDRRDHSLQIPNPVQAAQLGTPDPCTRCHIEQTPQWAASQSKRWWPSLAPSPYAELFDQARRQRPEAGDPLALFAQDANHPVMQRAAVLSRLAAYPGVNSAFAIKRAMQTGEPLLVDAAIEASSGFHAEDRWRLLAPVLAAGNDRQQAAAAQSLLPVFAQLTAQQQRTLAPALNRLETELSYQLDRGAGMTLMGDLVQAKGDMDQAQSWYQRAIEREPGFEVSYLHLAELQRAQGSEAKALNTLTQGRKAQPKGASLAHAHGLALIRAGQGSAALSALRDAVALAPQSGRYRYVYGLALEPESPKLAYRSLQEGFVVTGQPRLLYSACEIALRNRLSEAKVCLFHLTEQIGTEPVAELQARYPFSG